MSSWTVYNSRNQMMVDKFTELAIITSDEVENAFRCVSRAAFVSKELLDEAFLDAPIRSAPHIHMSSPHLYATILEKLELQPGMSFLNIGSGTGYFSCLAGYMIKKNGINHGVELHEDLVEFSRKRMADFFNNGPTVARDICPPTIIAGNCFQLDQSQMKYDRLYCGGACSDSIITFFLGFLKVGGFLIAPNSTKLIKLERVSRNEGVKSVIRSVWFAPLTRLSTADILKFRLGFLPRLRFPMKSKKEKTKKTFISNTDFPISHSPARKKIAKMRALQDALDSLEKDGSIPEPFCYVPQLEQANAYKQYNSAMECQMVKPVVEKTSLHNLSSSSVDEFLNNSQSLTHQLTTIGESTVENDTGYFSNSSQEIRHTTLTNDDNVASTGLITLTNHSEERNVENNENVSPSRDDVKCKGSVNAFDNEEVDNEICKDIWEHLSSDALWKMVLENYYSVCCNTKERRKKCFELQGRELVNPAATKLADMLLCKLQTRKNRTKVTNEHSNILEESIKSDEEKSSSINTEDPKNMQQLECNPTGNVSRCDCNCQHKYSSIPGDEIENRSCTCNHDIDKDVKTCLVELLDNVCTLLDSSTEEHEKLDLEESSDSIISFQSLSASFQSLSSTDDSSHNPNEKQHCKTKSKNSKKVKRKRYVDIRTDDVTFDNLRYVQHSGLWTIDHDIELISYLVKQRKESASFPLKLIKCDLFDKSKLIRHPLISSVPPPLLCYRSIALLRVVSVLDCVLDVLIGPSLPKNQFDSPLQQENYPLESFLESSFLPSDSQLNVLEAQTLRRSVIEETKDISMYQAAKSSQDEELLKEVFGIISNETNNVKQQQLILIRKLELIDNINEQYKEQVKLLSQQIDLIEEQQQLLFEVNMDSMETVAVMTSSQQLVTDRKQQRYTLIAKRDKINMEKKTQLAERKELLNMLEQLLSLETRLKQEMTSLEKKGMGYLRGEGNDLSHFSQFVSKAEKILKRLRLASSRMSDIMQKKFQGSADEDSAGTKGAEANRKVSFRYQPHTILPRCRFLLPLSKKRYLYMREMLRTTERSPPKHLPIINVDRTASLRERHKNGTSSTVFMQIFESLQSKELNYRWGKQHEQWWEVRFSGEGIIDQGGGFRDSLIEMAEELCPPEADLESCLPLFIKTPNQKSGIGDHLDGYTLNPNCKQYNLYRWIGKIMGACFRSDEFFPLPLPPYIWKQLVGEYVYWKKDYNHLDEAAVRNIDGLANLDEDAYTGLSIEQTYTTVLSDGTEVEVIASGSNVVVSPSERAKYSALARKARMMESCDQVLAVREGLLTVIPNGVISCLTWRNLEKGVCGNPSITVADLKANCRYGDDLKVTSQCVLHMWTALASFSEEDRGRFVRFITGRKRLPSPFIVSRSSSEKDGLPTASTCGSNLFLPEYSSLQIAKDKIKYAIYNCVAIDADTSPW